MSLQSPSRPPHSQVPGFQHLEVPHQSQKEKQNPQQYQEELQQNPHQHQQELQQNPQQHQQEKQQQQHSPHEHQQEKRQHSYQNQQEQQQSPPNRLQCEQKQHASPYQDQQEQQQHTHQNRKEQRNTHQHEQKQQQQQPPQCKQEQQHNSRQHQQEQQQQPPQCKQAQQHNSRQHQQEQQQQVNLHHLQPNQEHSPCQDQQGQQQQPPQQHQQFTSQHEHQHHDYQHQQRHPHQYLQHPHHYYHTPEHPHHYYHIPEQPHQNQKHPHHDHHIPQQPHHLQQPRYPYLQQMCLYPEVKTAIAPNVHSVTKQMHLVSPVQLGGSFASSPNNVQLSQNQQYVQRSAIHESRIPQHVHPPPLASHGAVVADKDLFLNTLTKFHAALGTKLSIPRIGGKDLDLHLLYKEVTARGGLEMVIKDRKWKEITLAFNFPPTTTSASFVLRKYYFYLLHQYEQVYFFQLKGPMVPSPVLQPTVSPGPHSLSEPECMHSPSEIAEVNLKKRKIDSAQALGVDPASSIGSVVTGCIDGKFEHGYLVSVTVGTRKMRGVLYHVPPSGTVPQSATVSPFVNSLGNELTTTITNHQIERRRKKKLMTRKDPNAPRQNRTGYNFFFAEQRARLKSTQPDKDRAISKMIGDLWNSLSEDEKLPYQERGLKEKERYRREMCEYKERLRLQAQGAVVGTGSSPSGLEMGTKSDHESDIDLNKVKSVDIKQEAMPYQEQVVHPLSGSSTVTDTSNHQPLVLENSGVNVVENLSPKDGYPATFDEQGMGKKSFELHILNQQKPT